MYKCDASVRSLCMQKSEDVVALVVVLRKCDGVCTVFFFFFKQKTAYEI